MKKDDTFIKIKCLKFYQKPNGVGSGALRLIMGAYIAAGH